MAHLWQASGSEVTLQLDLAGPVAIAMCCRFDLKHHNASTKTLKYNILLP